MPIPKPATIEVDDSLADLVHDEQVASRIRASVGLNFGTKLLSPGYVVWTPYQSIPRGIEQMALEIVAFDALIDNGDRRMNNPNLLAKQNEIFIIDHETAFSFCRLLGPHRVPFESCNMDFLRDHPLVHGLKHCTIGLQRFELELQRMDQSAVQSICTAPSEFGKAHLDKIETWLRSAADRSSLLSTAIGGILT
jgi:hypothetical protein